MKIPITKKSIPHTNAATLRCAAIITAALALTYGPGRALAQRPLGVDVSNNNGSLNWSQIKADGLTYSWAKATEGTYFTDSYFNGNINNGKSAGLLMGAYHFARPDLDSADTEAAFFWNVAAGKIVADGKTLMPALDYETAPGGTLAASAAWVNKWCEDIVNDAAAQGVVVQPVVYTYTSFATSWLDVSDTQWPLWMASPNGENSQTGSPSSISPWPNWTVWQYAQSTLVGMGSVVFDLDSFNGNSAQLVSTLVVPDHISPCVATTSDGRLDVFAIGSSGYLYQNYQTSPGGGWSGWQALSTSNTWHQNSMPAVGVNLDGRLEVFVTGTDGTVNHVWQKTAGSSASTNWSSYAQLSSHVYTANKLAVGKWANGALDVFVIGTDGALFHDNQTSPGGAWNGFVSLGGTWSQAADIAVSNDQNGEEDVFLIGNTGELYNNWQTAANGGSWHGWNAVGGLLAENARTALARNTNGKLEIFTLGTDGVAYHNWEKTANGQTSWNGWTSLGGNWEWNAKPVASIDQNGDLEVFLIGGTGNMYHNKQTSPSGSWTGWVELNGGFDESARPCVGTDQNGALEVFSTTGSGGALWHNWETSANSTTWNGWVSLGGSWN